jgi:hypothetical protein
MRTSPRPPYAKSRLAASAPVIERLLAVRPHFEYARLTRTWAMKTNKNAGTMNSR